MAPKNENSVLCGLQGSVAWLLWTHASPPWGLGVWD